MKLHVVTTSNLTQIRLGIYYHRDQSGRAEIIKGAMRLYDLWGGKDRQNPVWPVQVVYQKTAYKTVTKPLLPIL